MILELRDCISEKELKDVKELLKKQDLTFEDKVTSTIGYYDQGKLVATGSLYKNVIKMIAVDQAYQNENITSQIMSTLTQELNKQGIEKYFLYTKPQNVKLFEHFSLSLVEETESIALLENNINPINKQLKDIYQNLHLKKGSTAAIVMNCNPVTKGHLYLIETCAKENMNVIIFLVEENQSVFSYNVRYDLLKKATNHIENLHIVPSTPYIISSATFPTYFLKELSEISRIFMELDVSIFLKHFIPLFHIDYRYVGNEPLDPTTDAYNQTLKQILGPKLVIIDRLESNGKTISASLVRKLAAQNQFCELKNYVPDATYEFLISKQGQALFHD